MYTKIVVFKGNVDYTALAGTDILTGYPKNSLFGMCMILNTENVIILVLSYI